MKKSELRQLIREEHQRVILEGTWAIPKSAAESKKAYKALAKFKHLMGDIYGDDEIFDHIDEIEDRMKLIDQAIKKGDI